MHSEIIGHVLRRGVEHLTARQQYIQQLEHDAELYENAGPDMELKNSQFIPVFITLAIGALIIMSIDYTLGDVVSSLTMIESPSRTAIIDAKPPPAYTDEPDAPLEKEPTATVTDADVEITVIEHKPITTKVTSTIGLLHRVGGFTGRWRGLGLSVLYHSLHAVVANSIAFFLGFGFVGQAVASLIASICLVRVHLAWTHKMIAYPSAQPWYRRLPARKQCRALLLPALVHTAAQQATIAVPLGVAATFGMLSVNLPSMVREDHAACQQVVQLAMAALFVVLSWVIVTLTVLLPATIVRTRIEAALLPEGEEAIVSFDKQAAIGDLDLSVRSGCRAMFSQTWKSVDRATRWNVVKLYLKIFLAQFTVMLVTAHIVVAEVFVIGGEKLPIFFKSAAAQLKLAAIEANERQGN